MNILEFTERFLNVIQYIARSLYKLMGTCWEFREEPYQRCNIERFWKLLFLTIFAKHFILNYWEVSACVGFKYVRIVDMPRFWISRVKQGLQIFVNKTGFCICAGMQLWKGSEYFRIPNMPGFSIYKRYATLSMPNNVWINCSEYVWSKFQRVLNVPPVVNMPVPGVHCEYARNT